MGNPHQRVCEQIKTKNIFSHFGNFLYICIKLFDLRVIAKKTLRNFWTKYKDCESQLKSWYHEAHQAKWKNPNDIKQEFPFASFLPGNRVVFNIKGNDYRLIVRVNYDYGVVWVRFIGTHDQYDKIDAKTI